MTVGRPEDDVTITQFSRLARDRHGRYYVAPLATTGQIAVYGPEGRFRRTIGGAGDARDRLSVVRQVQFLPGDSAVVMDDIAFTVFSPEGRFVRSARFPEGINSFRFALLGDGRIVINNYGGAFRSYVLLDQAFRLVRTFGARLQGAPPDFERMQYHLVVAGSDIISPQASYRHVIDIRDTSGVLRRRLIADPPWFPPSSASVDDAPGLSPHPSLVSAFYDGKGRLWLAGVVPDGRWPGIARQLRGAPRLPDSLRTKSLDTVLEVLDLVTGSVIATERFDGLVNQFLSNGDVYGKKMSEGVLEFEVFRPAVVR